jgi:hypothetical protein
MLQFSDEIEECIEIAPDLRPEVALINIINLTNQLSQSGNMAKHTFGNEHNLVLNIYL